jgi:hypothetical protein
MLAQLVTRQRWGQHFANFGGATVAAIAVKVVISDQHRALLEGVGLSAIRRELVVGRLPWPPE